MSFEVTLSRRQEQAVAIALAAIPLLAVLLLVASQVPAWSAHRASIQTLMTERSAYGSAIGRVPALKESLSRLRRSQTAGGYFFTGAGGSDAAAKMRARIGAIVGGDGATIRRDEVELMAADDDAPVVLRATLSLTGDIKSLTRILHHLQQARPFLFVVQFAAHSSAGTGALTAPNVLQADLVIEGYMAAP
jgi:general secretion pathway protein M